MLSSALSWEGRGWNGSHSTQGWSNRHLTRIDGIFFYQCTAHKWTPTFQWPSYRNEAWKFNLYSIPLWGLCKSSWHAEVEIEIFYNDVHFCRTFISLQDKSQDALGTIANAHLCGLWFSRNLKEINSVLSRDPICEHVKWWCLTLKLK